jgi:hypothetical protein
MRNNESLTMTIPSVAKALGISSGLAYDLARRDELPVKVLRCGRRLLVSKKALNDLLSSNKGVRENGQDY